MRDLSCLIRCEAHDLCFGMHPLKEGDAQLSCCVPWGSCPLSRWCWVLGRVWKLCSSVAWLDFQSLETLWLWLTSPDLFLALEEVVVFALQIALCGLVLARSYLPTVGIFLLWYPLCLGLWVFFVGWFKVWNVSGQHCGVLSFQLLWEVKYVCLIEAITLLWLLWEAGH